MVTSPIRSQADPARPLTRLQPRQSACRCASEGRCRLPSRPITT